MFFKIHKDHITKGLHGALLYFEQENSELKMAGPIWLPLKYNSILMLHKFSIWVCIFITYAWIHGMEQTKNVHQKDSGNCYTTQSWINRVTSLG